MSSNLEILLAIKEALQFANDSPNGPINDTIWMKHRSETLFDFIDAAIADARTEAADTARLDFIATTAHSLKRDHKLRWWISTSINTTRGGVKDVRGAIDIAMTANRPAIVLAAAEMERDKK